MLDLLLKSSAVLGLVVTVVTTLLTYLVKKYLIPYLQVGQRYRYAEYIAVIADELTDDLRARYPDNDWLRRLDELIDKLIDICGCSTEVAERALRAAAARKQQEPLQG